MLLINNRSIDYSLTKCCYLFKGPLTIKFKILKIINYDKTNDNLSCSFVTTRSLIDCHGVQAETKSKAIISL